MTVATRFRCVVCGKLTAGRIGRATDPPYERGDTSHRFPRRHNGKDGKDCPGNVESAQWVDVDENGNVIHESAT